MQSITAVTANSTIRLIPPTGRKIINAPHVNTINPIKAKNITYNLIEVRLQFIHFLHSLHIGKSTTDTPYIRGSRLTLPLCAIFIV
ncbi:hypothetical protein A0J48_005255 [Sphaerospermopsis aphanizomenoides BCCUSP55]|nr:hypothetical protein [Sphaerospermopsis aphanizomenoides BCCUSP55]